MFSNLSYIFENADQILKTIDICKPPLKGLLTIMKIMVCIVSNFSYKTLRNDDLIHLIKF